MDPFLPGRAFDGIAYPWMSALSGAEENPGQNEDHLQGDIALAFLQHWQATRDVEWLEAKGFPVLHDLARFWVSRADRDSDGSWHIRSTMSPDEYASNKTDPPYTNSVAKISLMAAYDLAPIVGQTGNETFKTVANALPM